MKILFRAYNFIIKSITRSLIIFKKQISLITIDSSARSSGHHQSGACGRIKKKKKKMIKLLVIFLIRNIVILNKSDEMTVIFLFLFSIGNESLWNSDYGRIHIQLFYFLFRSLFCCWK